MRARFCRINFRLQRKSATVASSAAPAMLRTFRLDFEAVRLPESLDAQR